LKSSSESDTHFLHEFPAGSIRCIFACIHFTLRN
jgi:hypothetical protein